MESESSTSDSFVRKAARLQSVLTALVISLALLLLVERLGYAGVYDKSVGLERLIHQLVFALPSVLYLLALWCFRVAVKAIANGETFSGALAVMLRRASLLLIGGAITTLAMPLVYAMFGQPYPRLIEFDVTTLIIAGIGLAMWFVGQLLDRARELQAELDSFF
jgi:hypothetical protein